MHLLRRLAFLVAAIPSLLGAQTPRAASPEDVVRGFLDAVAAERWRDAADLLDVSQYAEGLRMTIEAARRPRSELPQLTVEELRRHDPEMPLAVAEYQLKKWREQVARPGDRMLEDYADVPSVDSLAHLAPREAAARWLQGTSEGVRRRRAAQYARASGCPHDSAFVEKYLRATTPHPVVVGSVVHTDVAYVLVLDREGRDVAVSELAASMPPRVVRVVRWGGRWLLRDWQEWRPQSGFIVSCDRPRER